MSAIRAYRVGLSSAPGVPVVRPASAFDGPSVGRASARRAPPVGPWRPGLAAPAFRGAGVSAPGWRATEAGAATTLSRDGAPEAAPITAARDAWAAPAAKDPGRFRAALAHQVRQDLWRALRTVRGFAPVVSVAAGTGGRVEVEAGGRLLAGSGARRQVEAAAAALLADPALRRRWTRHALRRAGGPA